ncbi:hypothetical protein CAPTEDRAFT_216758 [Capitella teleta]|uniref:Uncharacterized protein n=1 Tax=Capitella teleta TaxID=283909 RepID=R7V066_CAPTE|nr:hypothetical protein CAPTEDRAFT_216758 [Capitella teleta]|eukprot:ELU11954.1 hypothetical protein CAPTEDRAFT_216758 [Capitella teleta]
MSSDQNFTGSWDPDVYRDPILNVFKGGFNARFVRIYPTRRRKDLFTFASEHFSSPVAMCGFGGPACLRQENIPIRIQLKGIISAQKNIVLSLKGHSLVCNRYSTIVGIEKNANGCDIAYDLCEIEGARDDGRCQVWCRLKDAQVGQPMNLMLMVNGPSGTQLCAVETQDNAPHFKHGNITNYDAFIESITSGAN